MPRSGIVFDTTEWQHSFPALEAKIESSLSIIAEKVAGDAQDYMRSEAKWTDRTGNARNGLFAKAFNEPGNHVVVIYHTVNYGIWLEVRFSGKNAIIDPTLAYHGPRAMALVSGFISRIT